MGKKHLIPNTKQFKANLHCHTVLSDGKMTAEDLKKEYKNRGYSVVAFTDHELIFNHQDLNDENFIAITAYERALNIVPNQERPEYRDRICYHLNLYAKNPYEDSHVCFDKALTKWWYSRYHKEEPVDFDKINTAGETRSYRYEEVQTIVDTANKNGFLVCINHPYWSMQTHSDYFDIKGLFAMEVHNTGCGLVSGQAWDDYGMFCEINRQENLAPIAADDNHNAREFDRFADSFGGYTMICTDDFSYDSIFSAMQRRDVYASTGIDIKEIYTENGMLHASFTECTDCIVYFGTRDWSWNTELEGFTEVSLKIPETAVYVRVAFIDRRTGKRATTKAFKDFR